jgi:peptidoglycan/xylan/chitin deacetylase (PgdA/CDA1 family)
MQRLGDKPSGAVVSLTFDDGYEIQYDTFYPILSEYAIKATLYIITSKIGARGHLNWVELRHIFKEGNEIGSHTQTHPHLTTIPDEDLRQELEGSQNVLKEFNCRTLAYPYGEHDPRVVREAQKHYVACRGYYDLSKGSLDCGYNLDLTGELYALKVFPTEHVFPHHRKPLFELPRPEFENDIEEIIQNAIEKSAWVILVFHGQNSILFKTKWKLGLSSKFRWLCEYLANKDGLRILPVSEAVATTQRERSVP